MSDTRRDWIDLLGALLTPSIAFFGIAIAGIQWWGCGRALLDPAGSSVREKRISTWAQILERSPSVSRPLAAAPGPTAQDVGGAGVRG